MNLGQLIGELRMQIDGGGIEYRRPKKSRSEQVLELLAERGSVTCRDQVAALGITSTNAAVLLGSMFSAGKLKREGAPMRYRYSLP